MVERVFFSLSIVLASHLGSLVVGEESHIHRVRRKSQRSGRQTQCYMRVVPEGTHLTMMPQRVREGRDLPKVTRHADEKLGYEI